MEMQHTEAPSEVKAWANAPPSWLEKAQVKTLDRTLAIGLGIGEQEAISLALERHADVLLIDELAGRREAMMRHLTVAGTLAVLLEGALRGQLELSAEINHLRQLGFYIARSLEVDLLARYEEEKRSR